MTRKDGDSLLDFVSAVAGEELLKVEENLGDGFVRLRVGEAERRQAKHDIRRVEDAVVELLRNSRDAGAKRIFLAVSKEGRTRYVVCIDDGEGIPRHLHETVFEPRVTSKLDTMTMDTYGIHGRGMALYSLATNMQEARVVWSEPERGTVMFAIADTSVLGERKDQSTWPEIEASDEDCRSIRGPHNILRTVVEFALAAPGIDIYVGTQSEILTTMRILAGREHSFEHLFDEERTKDLSAWHHAATVVAPDRLAHVARVLYGFDISERNAQRILAEEMKELPSVRQRLGASRTATPSSERRIDLSKDRRSVRIEPEDLDHLATAVASAFAPIAEKYYLDPDSEASVTSTSDEIRIKVRLRKFE